MSCGPAVAVAVAVGNTLVSGTGPSASVIAVGRTSSHTAKAVPASSAISEPRNTRYEGSASAGSWQRSHSTSPCSSQ